MKETNPKSPTATPARPSFQKKTGTVSLSSILALGAFKGEAEAENSVESSKSELPLSCKGFPPVNAPFRDVKPDVKPYACPDYPNDLGTTRWFPTPTFTVRAFCDARREVWVLRVTEVLNMQQTQWMAAPDAPVTQETIEKATTTCNTLRSMLAGMEANIVNVIVQSPYLPIGFLQAHEDVHRKLAFAAAHIRYAQFCKKINAITIPCRKYFGPVSARESVDAEVDKATGEFNSDLDKDLLRIKQHHPKAAFYSAQKEACKEMLAKVAAEIAKRCPK